MQAKLGEATEAWENLATPIGELYDKTCDSEYENDRMARFDSRRCNPSCDLRVASACAPGHPAEASASDTEYDHVPMASRACFIPVQTCRDLGELSGRVDALLRQVQAAWNDIVRAQQALLEWKDFATVLSFVLRTDTTLTGTAAQAEKMELHTDVGRWLHILVSKLVTGSHPNHYHDSIIQAAYSIYAQSSAAYNSLRSVLHCLPSTRCLRGHADLGAVSAGYDPSAIRKFHHAATALGLISSTKNMQVALVFDDCDIQRTLNVSMRTGSLVGVSSDTNFKASYTPAELQHMAETNDYSEIINAAASHCGQWYVMSLDRKFHFPFGFQWVHESDPLRVHRQALWLNQIITILHANQFEVFAVVCDGHSNNVSLRTAFTAAFETVMSADTVASVNSRCDAAVSRIPMPTSATNAAREPQRTPYGIASTLGRSGNGDPVSSASARPAALVFDQEMERASCPHPILPYPYRLFFIPDVEHLSKVCYLVESCAIVLNAC